MFRGWPAFLVVAWSVWNPDASSAQDLRDSDYLRQTLNLVDYDLISLDLPETLEQSFEVVFSLDGASQTLVLESHSLRAHDFQLLVEDENGVREVDAPAPATYRGHIEGLEGSTVAASLVHGELYAIAMFENGSTFTIQPVSESLDGYSRDLHVAYWGSEIDELAQYRCGVEEEPTEQQQGGGDFDAQGTGLRVCDIAFDADVEFFNRNQGSVENTMIDIENVMVGVELIYERDTDISYEVTVILVRTSEPDPYGSTNASTLLNQFQNHWNGNQSAIRRDVAHLMTGKNLNGSTIGVAYLSVICDRPNAYGLSQSKFSSNYNSRISLTAHELGHNWSSGHCDGNGDCHIMCSGLGGCNGLGLPNFGTPSANRISNYAGGRGCLEDLLDPNPIPFFEDFPTTILNRQHWSYNRLGSINTGGENEPSPPNSMNLDASSSAENRDDDLRSGYILLGGEPLARLSYKVQHRNVEAGKTLTVDVWTTNLQWEIVNVITSDGSQQDQYVAYDHVLPVTALHDKARIRFRPDVANTSDDWFIDDILVEGAGCNDPVRYGNKTPGTGGVPPEIDWDGFPIVGSDDLVIKGSQFYGQQSGFMFVGFSQVSVQLGNGVWLNALPPWILVPVTTGGLALPGQGTLNIPAPIPDDDILAGVHFMVFFLVADPLSDSGFGGTEGLDFEICD